MKPNSIPWWQISCKTLRPEQMAILVTEFRKWGRLDANRFVHYCFTDSAGVYLVQGQIHEEMQQFFSAERKALIEVPRDHGKSVQVCARVLWELGHDPSLRIKVVCSSEAVAAERGRFMKDAIEHNIGLRMTFPQLKPADPWSATRFSVQRPANVIGPSVTAVGVGASLTGTRADLLVCDDIVDVKSIASRSERERIKAYFRDNLMNLLEPDGRCWCVFTPWHADDLNSELKRNEAFAHFRRAIDEELKPIWPERWSRERLEERRREIGGASFARGYRLIPLAPEEVAIRPELVRFWTDEMPLGTVILSVDPAVSAKERADASALVVLGKLAVVRAQSSDDDAEKSGERDEKSKNEIRCLEAIARRVNAPDLVHLIDDAERRWNPEAILFEDNAGFKGIKDLLIRHARFGPKIKGVTQSREKAARVGAFSVQIENGSFQLKGAPSGGVDPSQLGLFEEMTTFPCGEHDDLVDAAATGTEYLLEKREPRVFVM